MIHVSGERELPAQDGSAARTWPAAARASAASATGEAWHLKVETGPSMACATQLGGARVACNLGAAYDEGACAVKERYLNEISFLESRLQGVRQEIRDLRLAQKRPMKVELEEFFLLCMHDLRRDVQRRRGLAEAARHGTKGCMASRSPCAERTTQREQVIEILINSEDLVVLLYEKLFPHRTGSCLRSIERAPCAYAATDSCSSSGTAADPLVPLDFLELLP